MEKEIRQYSIEFNAAPDVATIEGRAIPFNIASPNREGFRETIAPEAVEGEDGVYFSFVPGNDDLSMYIKDRIQRGDIDEMSWAFTVESDTWVKAADGVYDRTINKFDQIYDLSIVDQSYYGIENAVKCARFAEIQEQERIENEARMAEEERLAQEQRELEEQEKVEKLKEYYKKLKEEYQEVLERDGKMSAN